MTYPRLSFFNWYVPNLIQNTGTIISDWWNDADGPLQWKNDAISSDLLSQDGNTFNRTMLAQFLLLLSHCFSHFIFAKKQSSYSAMIFNLHYIDNSWYFLKYWNFQAFWFFNMPGRVFLWEYDSNASGWPSNSNHQFLEIARLELSAVLFLFHKFFLFCWIWIV